MGMTPPPSPRLGSLGSGAITGIALAVQTGLAGVVGIVLGREFGRGALTDGFFAAYGAFIVVVLAANAIRVTVLPSFARARQDQRLSGEVAAYALTLASLAVPLLLVGIVVARQLADLLTGGNGGVALDTSAEALPWMLLAGTLQLCAGRAARARAARDDYVTPAVGFMLGSVAGLVFILARVDADGIAALSHGMALNGAIALAVPVVGLGVRAHSAAMPRSSARPAGETYGARLATMGSGVSLPLALQVIYLVCLPLAAREGDGALTSFGFAYLIASAVVAVTASSLGLVTAVPLARVGIDAFRTTRHVVASAWIALVVIGAAAGVFALAGGRIAQAVLGPSYSSDVGAELGRLVVVFSPFAVVSVGVSVTFPLVFVAGRGRALPVIAIAAIVIQVGLALVGQKLFGLNGLALALAATTAAVLGALLSGLGALGPTARGLVTAAVTVAVGAVLAYGPPSLLLAPIAAAALGLCVYLALLAVARPPGLVAAWRYLRALT
jgi:O-antigen/teichoic acid export membrane protein